MKPGQRQTGQLDKVIAWVQMRNRQIVRSGDLSKALAITIKQEVDLLSYLKKKGFLIQIKRGLYLAPLKLPPGKWTPSPYKILKILMEEISAQYQITGFYAFNRYGLSTQVPIEMAIYNTVLSGEKIIGVCPFQFIKVDKGRIGGTENIQIPDEQWATLDVPISSLARTLFDAVYDYKRFGTLPKAYEWIRQRKNDKKLIQSLIENTIQFGNVISKKRIGFILSKFNSPKMRLDKLWNAIPKTSSLDPLVPGKPERGPIDKKWRIIVNDFII